MTELHYVLAVLALAYMLGDATVEFIIEVVPTVKPKVFHY